MNVLNEKERKMSVSKNVRIVFSLAIGGLLLAGLLLLLEGTPQIAHADPGELFVTTTGSGTACTPDQPCALQEALAQAADGDVIVVAQGTYTGTGGAVVTLIKTVTLRGGWDGTTGPGSLRLPGTYTTTLDGENVRRVVYITGTVSPVLDGFTLRNGRVLNDSGGAVYAYNASPVIVNCRILSSTADQGGGVSFIYGAPTLRNSVVMNNVASGAGGGVYMLQSAAVLRANTILGNQAKWAGGFEIAGSDPFTMTNNIVARNSSQSGSSVRVYGISNHPTCPGECPSQGTLLHNTFVTNTSDISWMISAGPTTTLTFANTIIGLPGGIRVEAGGSVTMDKTLWETGCDTVSGYGTFLVRHSLYGDPAFVNPGSDDYHVGLASAAIDQGLDAGVGDDIDGQPRPQGSGYDIGADETGLIVTKQAEPNPVRPGTQLTYTIRVANTSDVALNATITDTLPFSITLDKTTGGTLSLPDGTVAITWTAVITEPGGIWTETVVVTVEVGYIGPLTNVVEVTTEEGAKGEGSVIVKAGLYLYLPVILLNYL